MKKIKKVAVTPIEPKTGHIYDTTNIDNKAENTYSANVIDKLNTYSATEQVVGTWVDGRPLYRKVIQLSTPTTNTNGTTAWSSPQLILENVDFVFLKNSFVVKPTVDGNSIYDEIIPAPFYNQTGMVIVALRKTNGNTVDCVLGNSITSYSNIPIYLICEYTKPTDKGNVMINFTVNCSHVDIGNKTYQAEYGMTWTEWIYSEYNVDGYYVEGTDIRLNAQYYLTSAKITDTIQANTAYATSKGK